MRTVSAAKPMGADRRIEVYTAQRHGGGLTRRQVRNMNQKANRAAGLDGRLPRELTARQIRWAGILSVRAARKQGETL